MICFTIKEDCSSFGSTTTFTAARGDNDGGDEVNIKGDVVVSGEGEDSTRDDIEVELLLLRSTTVAFSCFVSTLMSDSLADSLRCMVAASCDALLFRRLKKHNTQSKRNNHVNQCRFDILLATNK